MQDGSLPQVFAWNWEPSILIGLALFCGVYLCGVGPLRRRLDPTARMQVRQVASFLAGGFVIFLALVSPLDEIGDHYLFGAHMAQHLLLTLAMPPLILLGTPDYLLRPLLRARPLARAARVVTSPIFALLLFNVIFALYHIPALYDLALEDEGVHVLVHLLLMATALLAWWPILSPLPELPRLPYPVQVLYLFLAAIPPTLLGAVITFAESPLYLTYVDAPRQFGISALADQQAAGLIMWIPGSAVYLLALTIVFFKWFGGEEGSGSQGDVTVG